MYVCLHVYMYGYIYLDVTRNYACFTCSSTQDALCCLLYVCIVSLKRPTCPLLEGLKLRLCECIGLGNYRYDVYLGVDK